MGVPKNVIVTSKYTSGNEFVYAKTSSPYQGYYYEFNGKTFAGKEFNPKNPEILKKDSNSVNKLLNRSNSTIIYSLVSGVTSQMLSTPSITSIPSIVDRTSIKPIKFYCKKVNSNIIKEIDETTYTSLQSQPIYQTTFIGTYKGTTQTVDQAEQQIPGVKAFLAV
jgi:hypothetical protein